MKNEKFVKAFALILLVCVLSSLFVISSSASDDLVNGYYLQGVRLISSNPDLTYLDLPNSGLTFVTSGVPHCSVNFQSNGHKYIGISFYDPSFVGPNQSSGDIVYGLQFGWENQDFRLIDFGAGVEVSADVYYWILNNSTKVDDSSYMSGYLAGLETGLNSSDKKDQYYQEGYDEGFLDGSNSSSSTAFGQNLIGDTLSAPIRALNQFTLFVSPSGVPVSLGMIFGSLIAFILFLGFLKMFAGG